MSIKKRLLSILVIAIIQPGCYELTNNLVSGGTAVPETWFDKAIPIWPVWTLFYLTLIAFWSLAFIYGALKMDSQLYQAAFISAVLTIVPAMLIFIFWPNYIVRPQLVGDDFFTRMLRWVYAFDKPYNALPSGHMYMTFLIAIYYTRWKPNLKWWMGLVMVLMIPSTLFTKQHMALDLISAVILAFCADRLAMWWTFGRQSKQAKNIHGSIG